MPKFRCLIVLWIPLAISVLITLVLVSGYRPNWSQSTSTGRKFKAQQDVVSNNHAVNSNDPANTSSGSGQPDTEVAAESAKRPSSWLHSGRTTIRHEDVSWYQENQRKHSVIVPGARKLEDTPAGHCPLAKGNWCGPYWQQKLLPALPPPRLDKQCPGNCNNVGTCNYDTGICSCSAGWKGPGCETRDPRPCFNMGPDGRDKNLTDGGWLHTRCAGICDTDIGMCYCPPETKYGLKKDMNAPPGTPPEQQGRPMYWCQPNTTATGQAVKWSWNMHTYDDVFGPQGWCNANNYNAPRPCGCTLDGLQGRFCEHKVEQFCPNQCTGNGDCQLGYCKCHDGWWGQDCSQRRKGLEYKPTTLPHHLIQVVKQVPAAEDPPKRPFRKRPFIYVYDMPPRFVSLMLQYRLEGHACINRYFGEGNTPQFVGYNAYALETVFLELMLTSEHRTLDPEEADYFYVPLLISCLADVVGKSEKPIWPLTDNGAGMWGDRPYRMSMMALDAKRWIQENLPYWDRSGGKDHIFLFTHDEAPCYTHKELWDSIILSHWGRMDFPHGSNSSYPADNYSSDFLKKEWVSDTSRSHPCHDPEKHMVVPVFKHPNHYNRSPYLGGGTRERDILAFFRGDMGLNRPGCVYSRCIRQTLWKLYKENNWKQKYNIWYGDHAETPGDYSEIITRSKFCLVLPGDGWSARYEDSMTHGCVPVIVMDNTLGPFETLIDYTKFAIRLPESKLSSLVDVLQAVPPQQLKDMQEAGAHAWMRFRWNGIPLVEPYVLQAIKRNRPDGRMPDLPGTQWPQTADDDAFSTIIQWLYHRLPQDKKLKHDMELA